MGDIFITDDFLLSTDASRELFHDVAEKLPIIDYHCHLPPQQIAEDHRFENLTQIWLYGDHYKWRLMRAAGVEERYCTGDASDWEKFEKWAEVVPQALRNPLYHWTHLELKRPFGISDRLLNPDTAKSVWEECNAQLAKPEFSCRGIMKQMKVVLVCTTDDPADDLAHHRAIAKDGAFDIQVALLVFPVGKHPFVRKTIAVLGKAQPPIRIELDNLFAGFGGAGAVHELLVPAP